MNMKYVVRHEISYGPHEQASIEDFDFATLEEAKEFYDKRELGVFNFNEIIDLLTIHESKIAEE